VLRLTEYGKINSLTGYSTGEAEVDISAIEERGKALLVEVATPAAMILFRSAVLSGNLRSTELMPFATATASVGGSASKLNRKIDARIDSVISEMDNEIATEQDQIRKQFDEHLAVHCSLKDFLDDKLRVKDSFVDLEPIHSSEIDYENEVGKLYLVSTKSSVSHFQMCVNIWAQALSAEEIPDSMAEGQVKHSQQRTAATSSPDILKDKIEVEVK